MHELNISPGLETFNLNGVIEVTINPTDLNFIEKLYCVFEELDKKKEDYETRIEKAAGREKFAIARQLDKELREMTNSVFGCDVCTAIFGDISVCALADGVPLWANLFFSFMDLVSENATEEIKQTSSRVAKYAAKYTSKYHK